MEYNIRLDTIVARQPTAVVRRRACLRELSKVIPEGCGLMPPADWARLDRAEQLRPILCRLAADWRSGRTPEEPYPPAGGDNRRRTRGWRSSGCLICRRHPCAKLRGEAPAWLGRVGRCHFTV